MAEGVSIKLVSDWSRVARAGGKCKAGAGRRARDDWSVCCVQEPGEMRKSGVMAWKSRGLVNVFIFSGCCVLVLPRLANGKRWVRMGGVKHRL